MTRKLFAGALLESRDLRHFPQTQTSSIASWILQYLVFSCETCSYNTTVASFESVVQKSAPALNSFELLSGRRNSNNCFAMLFATQLARFAERQTLLDFT